MNGSKVEAVIGKVVKAVSSGVTNSRHKFKDQMITSRTGKREVGF